MLQRTLALTTVSVCGCLIIQFILGITTNLYVMIPTNLPHGNAWPWALWHNSVITPHILIGVLLLLLSLLSIVLSIMIKRRRFIVGCVIGFVAILAAWEFGDTFLGTGGPNWASFGMSLAFVMALVTFSLLAWNISRRKPIER